VTGEVIGITPWFYGRYSDDVSTLARDGAWVTVAVPFAVAHRLALPETVHARHSGLLGRGRAIRGTDGRSGLAQIVTFTCRPFGR
jgi:hypothetical protein